MSSVKQTVGMEAKGDPKARNVAMLREATDLHAKIVRAGKDLRALGKAAEVALDTANSVLNTALPQVYEDAAAVDHAMVQKHAPVGGAGYTPDAISKIKGDLQVKIQSDAFGPLDAWAAKFVDAQHKQKLVNKAYDAMVSARVKAAHQKDAADALTGKVMAQDPKLLEAQRKLQQMQDAYTIATNKHEEEEAAQYSRLVTLNREAAFIQTIIRQALGSTGAALVAAQDTIPEAPATPLGPSPSDAAAAATQAAQAAHAAAAAAHSAAAAPTAGYAVPPPAGAMPAGTYMTTA